MPGKYAIEIFYNAEDEDYIAIVPELAGCLAFGETGEEALKEAKVAIDLWLKTAMAEGSPIPEPHEKELLKSFIESRS